MSLDTQRCRATVHSDLFENSNWCWKYLWNFSPQRPSMFNWDTGDMNRCVMQTKYFHKEMISVLSRPENVRGKIVLLNKMLANVFLFTSPARVMNYLRSFINQVTKTCQNLFVKRSFLAFYLMLSYFNCSRKLLYRLSHSVLTSREIAVSALLPLRLS